MNIWLYIPDGGLSCCLHCPEMGQKAWFLNTQVTEQCPGATWENPASLKVSKFMEEGVEK